MRRSVSIIFLCVMIGIGLGLICYSWADEHPKKQITMIIPYAPGGISDLTSQVMAKFMSKSVGVSFVPTYKPGAAGTIAVKSLISSKPDGYTIIGGAVPTVVNFYPKVTKGVDYEIDAITPLFGYGMCPISFMVKADSPWKTFEDFIADAKKHPNQFRHGSYGAISLSHFCMALVNQIAGTETRHVPFDSSSKAMTALLGGHVDIVPATGSGGGLLKAGKVRGLAVATEERTDLVPGAPTLKELGYPIVVTFEYGFWCPKGTPQKIQKTLIAAAAKAFQEHPREIQDAFFNVEMVAGFKDQETYKRIVIDTDKTFDYVINLLNIPTKQK